MEKINIRNHTREVLADTVTPVGIYLKLRELYPKSVLLEGSDYHGDENSYSMICLQPMATITANLSEVKATLGERNLLKTRVDREGIAPLLSTFFNQFQFEKEIPETQNGFYGYSGYDAVQYFEDISLQAPRKDASEIPDLQYALYRYVIAINHFRNVMYITENRLEDEKPEIDRIETLIRNLSISSGTFALTGVEKSNCTDEQYIEMVSRGKKSCYHGDVFQIVLSRQFSQRFTGDDFNVYRVLRSINPSPYLFYFDYGTHRIFGSSPEIHLRITGNRAFINPIAGTFRRSGNDEQDKKKSQQLLADTKETAEHVMLVDLARNDLSRYGKDVKIEKFREIKYYSHVIHMVSTVSARLKEKTDRIKMFAATFPAGTLSGAPKYKAMQLIDIYEKQSRGYYGGAIGYFGTGNSVNHAIMIRTFLSKNNTLFYQAGAGVVARSIEEKELQEVNNKLAALKTALKMAEKI
ncbi:MAG: anthranilate synthase component I family protein [Chlorobi bacterium]|nr:anthranilate synthase component I family protein [Chlorobiota bacterium]